MSARYAPLPDLNYVPQVERLMRSGGHVTSNKQAQALKDTPLLTGDEAMRWLGRVEQAYTLLEDIYQDGLKIGVPKECARIVLPVGRYSRMRASANLRNWLAFMTLRADPGAQWEIQEFARAVGTVLSEQFPRTYALFAAER
jgi:thymidylate synthase (FAD)